MISPNMTCLVFIFDVFVVFVDCFQFEITSVSLSLRCPGSLLPVFESIIGCDTSKLLWVPFLLCLALWSVSSGLWAGLGVSTWLHRLQMMRSTKSWSGPDKGHWAYSMLSRTTKRKLTIWSRTTVLNGYPVPRTPKIVLPLAPFWSNFTSKIPSSSFQVMKDNDAKQYSYIYMVHMVLKSLLHQQWAQWGW